MKKFFKIFMLINLTSIMLLNIIFLDYKKAQAAPAIPFAIWGAAESALALFGAFGLEIGIKNAYSDHKVLDKDVIDVLQDFRGFMVGGAGVLALPYNLVEQQLNDLERTLQEAQIKGYLELARGNILKKVTMPDGPKKNKHEQSLIDSIKAYVVTRQVIEKNLNVGDQPINEFYDKDFFYNKWVENINKYCPNFLSDFDDTQKASFKNTIFDHVVPSSHYFYGANFVISPSGPAYDTLRFYFSYGQLPTSDLGKVYASYIDLRYGRINPYSQSMGLMNKVDGKLCLDFITNSNWQSIEDYKESHLINDLGTDGRITVNPDVSAIIDRDGNLDNFEILTHGTRLDPDGSVDGNIIIPVPKTFPENEPLPAGQTQPNLEYATQIDYGTGTNLNGQTNIVDLPVPDVVPSTDWTADEITTNEKSKGLATIFPFCIPFDLIAAFKLLKAPPEVPHWEFDWTIPSLNFSHHFVIDLSMFNILFIILNKMLLLVFMVSLILLTRTIIRG